MALDRRFVLQQTTTLLALGVPVADVERSLVWLEQRLPVDADPTTWIPTASELYEEPASEAAVLDARIDWYSNVPARFKRLLDARGIERA